MVTGRGARNGSARNKHATLPIWERTVNATGACVYLKLKSDHSGDEVRPEWRVNDDTGALYRARDRCILVQRPMRSESCTTRRRNAHGTAEYELLYPWQSITMTSA